MTEKEILDENQKLKNFLQCAIEEICILCKKINPQHINCHSCDDIDIYKKLLKGK
jgi:hypothetical protein